MKNPPQPRLWAGTEIRGRLLSSAGAYRGSDFFYYEDCAHFDRSRCREGLVIDSIPTCRPENLGTGVQHVPVPDGSVGSQGSLVEHDANQKKRPIRRFS